jgi:hypothetical protein
MPFPSDEFIHILEANDARIALEIHEATPLDQDGPLPSKGRAVPCTPTHRGTFEPYDQKLLDNPENVIDLQDPQGRSYPVVSFHHCTASTDNVHYHFRSPHPTE